MVVCMHYCGAAVIEGFGPREAREAVARGEHVTTLAFSESGSRSQFWAPMSTATGVNGAVRLDAKKSWVDLRRRGRFLRLVEQAAGRRGGEHDLAGAGEGAGPGRRRAF